MIQVLRSSERGHAAHGWLDSHHTFSFAEYYDPKRMGFSVLRVINEDRIEGGKGFGTHPHRDMEIITYVLSGALSHKDSMGNGSTLKPGDVQRMSAGTGVTHSEFNASPTEALHLLQIWILPGKTGIQPGYEEKTFSVEARRGNLRLVASSDGRDGSVLVHQDMALYASLLKAGERVQYENAQGRNVWLQVAHGQMRLNEVSLAAGDGVAVSDGEKLVLSGIEEAEFLLFDLP